MRPSYRVSIRRYLMAFGVALATPGLILAALLAWSLGNSERSRYEQGARDTALRIMAAVDRELAELQAGAQALATSGALLDGDYRAFHRQAVATLDSWPAERKDEYAVLVRDTTGQQVANTRLPPGAPLPRDAADLDADVVASKRPVTEGLVLGHEPGPHVSIRIPVLKDGVVAYVMRLEIAPRRLSEILAEQGLPPSWVATVVDRSDRVVARSRNPEAFLGQSAPEEFLRAATHEAGIWEGRNLEGARVVGAYARSGPLGWRTVVGVPAEIVEAPLKGSAMSFVALGSALLGLSFSLAAWLGRRIAAPIVAVSETAQRLGRGEAISPLATGLVEIDRLGNALISASAELRQREAALKDSEGRLRATHENAAVGIVEVDRDGRFLSVNEARCKLTGHSREELLGQNFTYSTHGSDLSRDLMQFRQQVAGELDSYTIENRFTHRDGRSGWVRVSSTAVRDASGRFLYAIRIVEDITERRQAEERQKLLIDELNHRVKNTLATVQSLAWQSAREGVPPEVAQERFQARLLALSRTHNLLNESSWVGASLRAVLKTELEPYAQGEGRVRMTGPDLDLPSRPAVVIGMAVHELATNAAKYGALSSPDGVVEIEWTRERHEEGCGLTIRWRELNGPPVTKPKRLGFGSRLIRQTITGELAGTLDLDFAPEGVCCRMVVPLEPAATDARAALS